MSRVFEALNKAEKEKERSAENVGSPSIEGEAENAPKTPLEESRPVFTADFDPPASLNGAGKPLPLHEPVTAIQGWRERIEELFFGWDLRRYASHPIVAVEGDSPASEQYKILREQIKRLRAEAGIRTIAITSPVKRDGKTTVSVNLAATISLEFGEKVLLIDADLRAPSIHRYFNDDPVPGLTDYLASNARASIKSLIRETHLSGLSILPSGKPSRFAPELLSNQRMARLLEEVRTELPGHFVIIDSPPVLATPDPLVLSRQVDGVIVVIRAGKTPRDYLTKALSFFNANKILGVVLNGADLGLGSKYYYYYSHNGRG